jgi:hypothetical protein
VDRREAFDSDAPCSVNGEGTAAATIIIISLDEE